MNATRLPNESPGVWSMADVVPDVLARYGIVPESDRQEHRSRHAAQTAGNRLQAAGVSPPPPIWPLPAAADAMPSGYCP